MRRPFVAGNWKMNNTLSEARALMGELREQLSPQAAVDVAVFTPSTLLYPMGREIDGTAIALGAQNCHFEPSGAFTGEVSPRMIKEAGCTYVLVGHSERRQHFGEGGEILKLKLEAALRAGLDVIYCIGETHEQRQRGETEAVLDRQMAEVLHGELDAGRLTMAYEPVWAIGTGVTATSEQAQASHQFVRSKLASIFGPSGAAQMRIQYGGSVKPGNAAELMACPDVDGALVGGASLVAGDFVAIIAAAAAASR